MTIEQALADPTVAQQAGRVWAIVPMAGGRVAYTDNGKLEEIENADRGDGTFGPEVWIFKAGF